MLKQPFLPLKFYNELEEQQYRKLDENMGAEWTKITSDIVTAPRFQIKRENRPNLITQFDLVEFYAGAVENILTVFLDIKSGVIDGTTFNWIVSDGFPWSNDVEPGAYYFIISDGVETWYSEVFDLCDLYTNLISNGINDSFDNFIETLFPLIKRDIWWICKSTSAGIASAHSNEFDVIYDEPLMFYVRCDESIFACGFTDFGDTVKYELRDAAGNVVSNTFQTEQGFNCGQLLPEITGTVRLYVWLDDGEQSRQFNWVYLWPKKIADFTVLEWSDSINFCDIIYHDDVGDDNCDYINQLILSRANTILPTYTVEKEAVETDEKEQAFMMQVLKKFHTLKLAGGHHLSDALALTGLHDDINVYFETGEVLDICEFTMENTPVTDFCEKMTLQFREKDCAKDNCDDYTLTECCCPNLDDVLDELANVAALPGQPCCDGDRYLVDDAGTLKVFESDGAAWNHQAAEDVNCNCLIDLDTNDSDTNDYPQMWWYCAGWDELATWTFNDLGGGAGVEVDVATNYGVSCSSCLCDDLFVQLQANDGVGWENVGEAYEWTSVPRDIEIAAGTYDFRVIVFQHNCTWFLYGDQNVVIT